MRCPSVHGALLVLLISGTVFAGEYQRTRDGKTLVWNEDHKPGATVSWSGKRDADGYATGHGTLTWYAPEDINEVGSNLPRKRYRISSSASGTMVHGKFEQASPRTTAETTVEPAKPKRRGWLGIFGGRSEPSPIEATPAPKSPSKRIKATPKEPSPAETNAVATPAPAVTPTSGAAPTPSAGTESLDSLMHAPSSLKVGSPSPSPSPAVSSVSGTPDVSLQLAQPPSASPSPSPQ